VAQAIVQEIQAKLTLPEQARLRSVRLIAPEAYEAYLKGRYYSNRRTEEGLKRGIAHFQEAIEQDPSYPVTYVGLADSYNLLGFYSLIPPREAFPKAKAAASRALEIAPDLVEAQASLAYVALYYEWDWAGAEAAFRRAIDLKEGYPTAHLWYANLLTARGRHDEALREFQRTAELDPLAGVASTAVAWSLYFARRYEEAGPMFRKAIELDPGFLPARIWYGWALAAMGRTADAVGQLEEALRMGGLDVLANASLAWAHALQGDGAKAAELLGLLLEQRKERYVDCCFFAFIHAALGNRSEALDWLERAHEERSHWLVLLAVDPKLDPLRQEPRFLDLIRRVGIKTS
jgi:tetratricopeptide (TPR) repeat protein